MFIKALENCLVAATSDAKHYLESRDIPKYGVSHITWCIPVLKCIKLICGYPGSVLLLPGKPERLVSLALVSMMHFCCFSSMEHEKHTIYLYILFPFPGKLLKI